MTEPAPRPLVIAHRAGNDIPLLRLAEESGADLVEADIWWYRGALEARHLKTMGPVPLLWDRWKLTGRWRPRLKLPELARATAPGTHLFLDLKGRHPLLPELVVEAMADAAPGRP
jgi:glycerophosphoryl diester phosphodiesterase